MAQSLLTVRIFNGARQEMNSGEKILITITNGKGDLLKRKEFPSGVTFKLPFYDNFGDNFTVIAFLDGYEQAGFTPIKCSPAAPQTLDLMLLKKNGGYNFAQAKWADLKTNYSNIFSFLSSGVSDAAGKARYEDLLENHTPALACFFNLTTAMAAIQLPQKTALDYFKQPIWDATLAQDRFFAYADPALYDQVKLSAIQGGFEREPGFAAFHKGATDSYKQVQFGEANVQLTFHANDTKVINGLTCIKMEPDIDYFRDLLSHALLEVIVNGISHSLTDPRQVYVLRWIAGRHAGVSEFNPPYTLE